MKTTLNTSSGIYYMGRWQTGKRIIITPFRIVLFLMILTWTFTGLRSFGQGVGISEASITPDASSILELRSTLRGLLAPRMTGGQRDAIPSPATGLLIYNTSTNKLNIYNGTSWVILFSGNAGVNSVSGTANRISISGTTDVNVDIAGTYAGQTSITTLGTIATGTWNSTAVGIGYGGTGQTTAPAAFNALSPMTTLGDIIYGGAGGTGTRLAGNITTNSLVLKQTGTGAASAAPVWGTLNNSDVGLGNVENTALSTWTGSGNITTIGTIGSGIWNGGIITGQYGGTGINNSGRTISLGGNLVTSGAFATTLTVTGATNITLPTTGTLVNNAVTTLSSLASIGTITTGIWNGTTIGIGYGGTGQTTAPAAFNALSPITTLGDLIYGSAANTSSRLAGNITTTPMVLKQTGTGAVSAAPAWGALSRSDVGLGNVENTALSTWTGSGNITTVGTIGSGTWNGGIITGQYGGTGINNSGRTITLGGNLTTSGAFATTFTVTGATNVTLPTTGTLVNSAVTTLSSLASIGTITTGIWNGTRIGLAYGGTNTDLSTGAAIGDILFANATTSFARLAGVATGNALISGGTGVAPSWGKIGLTTHVSGTLPIGSGGTGQTTALTAFNALSPMISQGDIIYGGVGGTGTRLPAGTAGQVLAMNGGATAPQWQDAGSGDMILGAAQTVTGVKTFSAMPVFPSLTQGSVLFVGAGNVLAENNANFFWDNANSRLGIGTASPIERLTIGGASGSYERISRNVTNGSLGLWGGTSEATGAYFKINGSGNSGSPGRGSAEFVLRNFSDSKFALWGYDGASSWAHIFVVSGQNGNTWLVPTDEYSSGRVGVGVAYNDGSTLPTAILHIKSNPGTANNAPLKFTAGTNMLTPEDGAVEYDGTNYFVSAGTTRYTLAKTLTTSASLNFPSTTNGSYSDINVTTGLTGATDGDAVVLGILNAAISTSTTYTAWVSSAGTVTVRFSNNSGAPIDPPARAFRISVLKY